MTESAPQPAVQPLLVPQTMVQTLTEHLLCTRRQDASMHGYHLGFQEALSPGESRFWATRLAAFRLPPRHGSATWAESYLSVPQSLTCTVGDEFQAGTFVVRAARHVPREAAAWCGAHRKLTARVVVFTVCGLGAVRGFSEEGALKKVCSTDVSWHSRDRRHS